ncbi:acylphosphatase, partial [Rhodoferax sp. 4810]|nr:acylphosphatase [Rhodoferax jenense]
RQLKLTGWVRNRRDGSVETVLRGAEHNVTAMLEWLRQGPPLARVDNLYPSEITMDEQYTTFEVRRG